MENTKTLFFFNSVTLIPFHLLFFLISGLELEKLKWKVVSPVAITTLRALKCWFKESLNFFPVLGHLYQWPSHEWRHCRHGASLCLSYPGTSARPGAQSVLSICLFSDWRDALPCKIITLPAIIEMSGLTPPRSGPWLLCPGRLPTLSGARSLHLWLVHVNVWPLVSSL